MIKHRSILLYPVSLIFGIVTGIRNMLFNTGVLKSTGFPIPVICVGNITVGGTGKTPHTEYLAGLLSSHFRVAVLSRGYKRKSKGFRVAGPGSTVSEIGDEPMQIALKLKNVIVAVDTERVNGVKKLLELYPDLSVIILDDAYQHRQIIPGLSILLTDYNRLFIHDHLLPYGNLRESSSGMERADIILVTKSPPGISPIQRRIIVKEMNKAAYQNLYFTAIDYLHPVPVFDSDARELILSSENASERKAIVVTGIASAEPFIEFINQFFADTVHIRFPDHYAFGKGDFEKILDAWTAAGNGEKYIITTEKDSIRIREEFSNIAEVLRKAIYYVPIGVSFLNDDQEEFNKLIIDYVRKNKRNNRIS